MDKEDARSLSAVTQEEKRKQAIRLRKRSYTYKVIGEIVGAHERTVIRWVRSYEAYGVNGLKAKKQDRPLGAGRFLTPGRAKGDATEWYLLKGIVSYNQMVTE